MGYVEYEAETLGKRFQGAQWQGSIERDRGLSERRLTISGNQSSATVAFPRIMQGDHDP